MIKLAYTEEMKKQDELWEKENEDFRTMEKLQKRIVKAAAASGFKGKSETIVYADREVITDIFKTQNDLLKEKRTGNGYQIASCGCCRSLIESLEDIINKH